MKLDITRDVQSNNVLELNDAELAVVSGGDWGHGGGDHGHGGWDHDHGGWDHDHGGWGHHWGSWGGNYWQGSDCSDGYNSQPQILILQQQSSPYVLVPSSSCGY